MHEVLRACLPQTNGRKDMPGEGFDGRAYSAITVQVRASSRTIASAGDVSLSYESPSQSMNGSEGETGLQELKNRLEAWALPA